jgi:hypothetical protein
MCCFGIKCAISGIKCAVFGIKCAVCYCPCGVFERGLVFYVIVIRCLNSGFRA